jgi:hypothetical protein
MFYAEREHEKALGGQRPARRRSLPPELAQHVRMILPQRSPHLAEQRVARRLRQPAEENPQRARAVLPPSPLDLLLVREHAVHIGWLGGAARGMLVSVRAAVFAAPRAERARATVALERGTAVEVDEDRPACAEDAFNDVVYAKDPKIDDAGLRYSLRSETDAIIQRGRRVGAHLQSGQHLFRISSSTRLRAASTSRCAPSSACSRAISSRSRSCASRSNSLRMMPSSSSIRERRYASNAAAGTACASSLSPNGGASHPSAGVARGHGTRPPRCRRTRRSSPAHFRT